MWTLFEARFSEVAVASFDRIPFESGAYIVRRPGRPSWYLETYAGGTQIRRTLKTNNRALALDRARA